MPRIRGIAHVELSVSNLDASAAWYAALLGATETFRAAKAAEDIVCLYLAYGVADESRARAPVVVEVIFVTPDHLRTRPHVHSAA